MAKKALTKPARGTRDFLPDDIRRREYVTRIIREVYESHGFLPLETPTFERLDTLLGKYGDEGDQLVFKILYRGQPLVKGIRDASAHLEEDGAVVTGRSGETAPGAERLLSDMGLRYDLTVPLARVVAEYDGKIPMPFKRYQIQPVWRADTPGKGRFREFYQCDVDVCGGQSPLDEAEVTGAVAQCLVRLGFDAFEIRLNHRGLLRAFIEHAGVSVEREFAAIVAIDKLDKIGREGVTKELAAKGFNDDQQRALMDLVLTDAASTDALRERLAGNERAVAALDEIDQLLTYSEQTPAKGRLRFDPTLARGLGYYTGCIFEIAVEDLAGSLGGGGRYDELVGMFLGRAVPACGFSIGLERILVVMEQRGMFPDELSSGRVLLMTADKSAVSRLLPLAYTLRAEGIIIDVHPKADKPGKMRKRAAERGYDHVLIVRTDSTTAVNVWNTAEPDVTDRMIEIETLAAHLSH